MKRLWIAVGILALLCAATLWSGMSLARFTGELTSALSQANTLAEEGSWEDAARLTENAHRRFQEKAFYLHVTIRHSDIEEAEAAFREVEQLLSHRERLGEYAAANAKLLARLELLAESEQLTLNNIL